MHSHKATTQAEFQYTPNCIEPPIPLDITFQTEHGDLLGGNKSPSLLNRYALIFIFGYIA
jgi:hypothetical protein